jgi:hypothetical protein
MGTCHKCGRMTALKYVIYLGGQCGIIGPYWHCARCIMSRITEGKAAEVHELGESVFNWAKWIVEEEEDL